MASSAAQHSQSLESWYIHVPGLVVLAPFTPADCKGLLKSAIRCDDPVIIFEPRARWQSPGEVPDGDHCVPIGKARVARSGTDLTVVTWSAMTAVVQGAVDACAAEGIDVELIDLRSLWPWDVDAVVESVRKTSRLLVVHEAVRVCGFGAEIMATVVDRAFGDLSRAPGRLGAPRAPVAFSPPLEDVYRVSQPKIESAIRAMAAA